MNADELLRRYAAEDRDFTGANLKTCVEMQMLWLGDVDSDETVETTAPVEPTL